MTTTAWNWSGHGGVVAGTRGDDDDGAGGPSSLVRAAPAAVAVASRCARSSSTRGDIWGPVRLAVEEEDGSLDHTREKVAHLLIIICRSRGSNDGMMIPRRRRRRPRPSGAYHGHLVMLRRQRKRARKQTGALLSATRGHLYPSQYMCIYRIIW